MRLFYQNQSEDGKEMRRERVILGLSNPEILLSQW
jgi:hypothetical protein